MYVYVVCAQLFGTMFAAWMYRSGRMSPAPPDRCCLSGHFQGRTIHSGSDLAGRINSGPNWFGFGCTTGSGWKIFWSRKVHVPPCVATPDGRCDTARHRSGRQPRGAEQAAQLPDNGPCCGCRRVVVTTSLHICTWFIFSRHGPSFSPCLFCSCHAHSPSPLSSLSPRAEHGRYHCSYCFPFDRVVESLLTLFSRFFGGSRRPRGGFA